MTPLQVGAVIRSYYVNAEASTIDRQAENYVQDVGIPPCPAILTRLMRETRQDEPDFRRVSQLIARDVALAASVLKIANSPFYGLRAKMSSVQHALAMLGLSAVSQLVTGLLLRQAFPAGSGSGMERFWKFSMATALAAAFVGRETGRADPGTAHSYGLFRDCGMPVMLRKFPIYGDLLDGTALESGDPILEIEEERYAMNHARIGEQLARSWHLGDPLCLAIRHHHHILSSPEVCGEATDEIRALVATGLVAEFLYCRATSQPCYDWDRDGDYAADVLDLDSAKLDDMASRVKGALAAA